MIEYTTGNLLKAPVEALVNTVNCCGVMGAGIALQFKRTYPAVFDRYKQACDAKQVTVGSMLIVPTNRPSGPRYVVNFPTKKCWRNKSKLDFIDQGLVALVADVRRLGIRSIAIPPLGCGLGGLDWAVVKPRIEAAFSALPEVRVLVYEPATSAAM